MEEVWDNSFYERIGLKCGLEIHQQLDTRKLFCRCQSVLRNDEPDFIIKRKLHLVAGELGEVDIAAQYQKSLGKEFVYEGYLDNTCLVEIDESPPLEINEEALRIALSISLLLNCKIVPITQIMRKTVVDGSNTSGFQRSVLIARDGFVKMPWGIVRIDYLYLEEDAARRIREDDEECVVYRLDRLGIPLVEIVTAPDIKNPEQARDTALQIGKILRLCKVKRGIGTIRQDINISISGHPRAEIKGFQDPKIFVTVVKKEVERQLEDLRKGKKDLFPEVRAANLDGTTRYLRPLPGPARMYPETDLPLLRISKKVINEVKKTLPKIREGVEELERRGLNKEMIKLLTSNPEKIEEFKSLLSVFNNPLLVAKVLLIYPNEIAKKHSDSINDFESILEKINSVLENILLAVKEKKISEGQIKSVMEEVAKGKDIELALRLKKEDTSIIEEKIINLIKERPGLSENAYMGLIMKEFKGRVDGKEVMELVKKYMKK
ncbi:MAG: Glu-tRNA(Gln) amidotransferase subunit GatE [Candidatus Pacearchaeota archaeon]